MMHFRHRKQNTRHSNNNNHEGTVGPSHDNHYDYYDDDAKQEPCRRRRGRLRQRQIQNRKHGCSIPLLLLSSVVVVVVIFSLGYYSYYDFNYHDWLLVDVMKNFLKGPSKQDIQASHALRRSQQQSQQQQQQPQQQRRKPEDPRPPPTNVFTGLSRKQYAKWQRMQRYFNDEMSQEKRKRIIPCTLTPSWMLDSIIMMRENHNNNNNNKDACAAFFSKEEKDKEGKSNNNNNMVSKVASWFQKRSATTTPKPQKLLFRNTLPEKRYVCGHVLWGNGGILELEYPLKGDCQKSSSSSLRPYVFAPHPPPVNGTGMRPIELYWNVDNNNNDYDYYNGHSDYYGYQTHVFVDGGDQQTCPNIACRRNDEALHQLQNVIRIKDTPWEIWSTMEGPEYYSTARVGRQGYLKNVYFATTSFKSDIPMPYFSWSEYGNDMFYASTTSVVSQNFHKVIQGASFLANNCDSKSHREDLVKRLMNDTRFPLRVDSLSSCLHNAAFPSKDVIQSSLSSSSLPIDPDNKTQIQQQYLFHLAFENQLSEDYITEKLWGTFKSGTLPIYYGAPNVKDHLPSPNAAILVEDYLPNDLPKLLEYLHTLTQNPDLYDQHHQWRRPSQHDDDHQQQQFHAKYDMTHRHSTCRMCEWAYAKKHGLGWNHVAQQVQQPLVRHETCRNRQGFLGHPVKEYWYTVVDNNTKKQVAASVSSPMATSKTCTLNAENRLLELDHGRVQRYIYDQDGVTDMIIIITKTTSTTKANDDDDDDDDDQQRQYVLALKTPIASSELVEKESGKEYWLQDAQSRMTLLIDTNTTTTTTTTASSTFNIVPAVTMVQDQQEDNNSNPGSTTSSFGMIRILPIVTGDNDDDGVAVLRLRIIVENLDTFHRGAIHRANYFGNLMTRDFFQPVEAYVIVPS